MWLRRLLLLLLLLTMTMTMTMTWFRSVLKIHLLLIRFLIYVWTRETTGDVADSSTIEIAVAPPPPAAAAAAAAAVVVVAVATSSSPEGL
jgi:hypothetical protein